MPINICTVSYTHLDVYKRQSVRRVRMGTVLLVLANQTRREMGLQDVAVYDTELAVKTAVAGIRELIESDRQK